MKLILHGPYEGRTVTLRDIKFVKGVAEIPGSIAYNEGLVTYMGRVYQAYPEGMTRQEGVEYASKVPTTALKGHTAEVPSDREPIGTKSPTSSTNNGPGATGVETGAEGGMADGSGYENPRLHPKLGQVLSQLDHANDTHWTKDGKPSLPMIEELLGSSGITRKDVEAMAPTLRRKN